MGKQSQTTSTTTLPGYVSDLGSYLSNYGLNLGNNQPAVPLQGTQGFSTDQSNAFQQLRDLISNSPNVGGQAIDWTQQYASAPASTVNVGTVDPSQVNTQPYMTAASGALQPTLDVIQQGADQQRKQLLAQASMAGGGTGGAGVADPQALVAQGVADMNTQRARSEAAGTAYGNAFQNAINTAMQNAQGIMMPEQEANAAYKEQQLGRTGAGAGQILSDVSANQGTLLQQIQSLLQTGGLEQGQGQTILNALFNQGMTQYQEPFQIAQTLSGMLGAMRGTTNSTTTNTQPNNSLLGLAGSLGGASINALPGLLALA